MIQSITQNEARVGAFTSSQIYRLMGSDRVRSTYIEEKRIEKRLGRSIELDKYSRPMAWGTLLETRVFDLLGLEYTPVGNDTVVHPEIPEWAGSADLIAPMLGKISEVKCYEPKKFCQYTDALLSGDINHLRSDFAEEYWQMVSNAILNGMAYAEAITYMPYQSELQEIRDLAADYPYADPWKYRFIYESQDYELAYLPDGGYYKNLNIFCFEVPGEDIKVLTERVKSAVELLNQKQ